MKTAISLPDELFEAMEQLVRRSGGSRSELYASALREYVQRHSPDAVTEAMNETLRQLNGESGYDFSSTAAQRILADSEW